MDKPVFDEGLILPDKLICLSKTRVAPRAATKLRMLHPGTDNVSKGPAVAAPQLPGGGGDGHRWN